MISPKNIFVQVLPTSLVYGLVGGILLVGLTELFSEGFYLIIPIPIVMIAALLRIRKTNPVEFTFYKAFLSGFLTYMVIPIVYFIYIRSYVVPKPEAGWSALLDWSLLGAIRNNLITAIISSAVLAIIFKIYYLNRN